MLWFFCLVFFFKSHCFSGPAAEAVRSQLAGRQPVEQPGRRSPPALESITSKWLHAHVPPAAGAACPAFQSTAAERIWPQPWQKGGIFLLLAAARVSVAHRQRSYPSRVKPSPGLCSVAAKRPQESRAKLSHPEKELRVTEVRG